MQIDSGNFTTKTSSSLQYKLYTPDDYDGSEALPLIMHLHGSGERGNKLETMLKQGLPRKLEAGDELPFIVLAPQCPYNEPWTHYSDTLIAMLDSVLQKYAVDDQRIYLTGFSLGGFGTWYLASQHPDRFAAIAPICGFEMLFLGFPERLKRMTHIPVWAFHGDADSVVPLEEHKDLVDAFISYGGNAKWTVYAGVDHDSWTQTYDNPELYEWFLQHKG